MIFSKGNLMVSQVASKNPSDLGINCLHLNADGSTVATNAKIIMAVGPVQEDKVRFPDVGDQTTPGTQGVSIPLDLIEGVVKNLPKDKKPQLQHAAMTRGRDPAKVEFSTTDMRHEQRIAGFPKREPFPDWRGVLRRIRGVSGHRICVNRRDLIDLLNAMEDACPDRGGDNPVFMEINPQGSGMILRCVNRESGQRALGGITAYNTGGQWLPADSWEGEVFKTEVKRVIKRQGDEA